MTSEIPKVGNGATEVLARAEENLPIIHHVSSNRVPLPASEPIILGEANRTGNGFDLPLEVKQRTEAEARKKLFK